MKRLGIIKALTLLVAILQHWLKVNDDRGANNALLLMQLYSHALFSGDVTLLTDLIEGQPNLDSQVNTAIEQRDLKRALLVEYINGFIRRMHTYKAALEGTGIILSLPKPVAVTYSDRRIIAAALAIKVEWEKLHGLTLADVPNPLILNGGGTLALFSSALEAFRLVGPALDAARIAAKDNRIARDNLLYRKLHGYVVEYRRKINDLYAPHSNIRQELPRLSPPPGTSPEAVTLLGGWNETEGKAVLSWTACTHPDLAHYQVRACFDAKYRVAEDIVIGNVAKDQLTYQTEVGLIAEGSVVSYKVYAMTTQGRERGSHTVKVTRLAPAVPVA